MADDPKPDPPEPKEPDSSKDNKDLGEAGKKALDAERKARRDAEARVKELEPLAQKVKEAEEKDKSEIQKLTDAKTVAETKAAEAELRALRYEVAHEKGLTPTQAKRLMGSTKEELEADADELLDAFKSESDSKDDQKPNRKPKPNLKGGLEPDEEPDVDIRKMVESIPRGM